MLASTGDAPLESAALAYEPKYDGIRALASVHGSEVHFWSRLGNEKTAQFPEVAAALRAWGRGRARPVLFDGEIVALDGRGAPVGFQNLQGRIHLKSPAAPLEVAFIVFDLLRDGDEDLRPFPLHERRARLAPLLDGVRDPRLRMSEQVTGDGRALHERAEAQGWEGIIAKRLDSVYNSGRRSPDWRKLKLVRRQACVIAGWTEPRGSRPFFGALLLGVYDETGRLQYIGHTGAGFSDAELGRVWKRLHALKTRTCPFSIIPRTNERAHWVKPALVAEVKFTEWTADRKLRHPTYLGLRDDIAPASVRKEPDTLARGARESAARREQRAVRPAHVEVRPLAAEREPKGAVSRAAVTKLLDQLDAIEQGPGGGVLQLPGGDRLEISNLGKIFWPKLKLTKGDLFRHYVRVASVILPVLDDRPLVMKRYPNGVAGKPFYQHRAPDKLPPGVRVEVVASDTESRAHLIGGSLVTLLYCAQLAAISEDPWFSRVGLAGHDRSHRHRPRSPGRPAVRARPRRGALGARGARRSEGVRVCQDVGLGRAAHLHPDAAGHAVRGGSPLRADRGDAGREEAPEGGHRGTIDRGARPPHLRRLPAEHQGQDAGERLQRTRERLCRRLDAADVGRD